MRYPTALAVLALLLCAGPVAAQIDPEPRTPYLWRVVLKAEPHPLLSATFREHLRRDLTAALQPALGTLGSVEVLDLAAAGPRDAWDPLWQQFDDKGFDALAAPRDLTGAKTHFLRIEYRDGQYHLESRQYDGFAGLASPVVRRQSVRAPELVGRAAGLMLDRDFGLTGSIEPVIGKADELKVIVRGGQLGSLDRFVKVGDVFSVSQVFKTNRPAPPPIRTATGKVIAPPPGSVPPPGLSSTPRAFTLLKVIDVGKDGTLRCAALTQYKNATPMGGNVVAYRCLKLGTVAERLTVRLVTSDPAYQKSFGLVSVQASDQGFDVKPESCEYKDKDSVFRSGRPLKNLACITVSLGGRQKQFPVPVLGAEPVTLPFEINPKLEEEAAHMRAVLAAAARVADARNAQTICFEATAKLIEKQKNAEAHARARGGFQAADAADKGLTDELARLKEQPEKTADSARLMASIEQQLAALRQFNVQLGTHVKTLEVIVARENDPRIAARDVQAEALNERLKFLLARGDIDEAINAYGQLITILPDDADLKARRDKLVAEWKPKNDAHAKAREYLLKTWPAVATIPDFKDAVPPLTAAVDECMKNSDRFTLRKLLTLFTAAGVKLNDLVTPLDSNTDADRKLFDDAKKVGEALAALEAKITDFVKKE